MIKNKEITWKEAERILIKNNPKLLFWFALYEIPLQIQRLKIKYSLWKKRNANRTI